MKNLRHLNRGAGRLRGSALLIVLAFIVILTVILLAYLSRTERMQQISDSSASNVKSDLLAEIATTAIIADLREEMAAGSDNEEDFEIGRNMAVSQPWAMVPARVLADGIDPTDENFANLVKQSVRKKPFYPGSSPAVFSGTGPARASEISTAEPASNGRIISIGRWNKPILLGGSGFTNVNQLPDWILITRDGPLRSGSFPGKDFMKKAPGNLDYVIGRYAYNIYDTSGLLNINVAGFDPSDATSAGHAMRKGSIAWADLTAIPGVVNAAGIVGWRNKLSRSNYLSMIMGDVPEGQPGEPRPWGEAGGFREAFTNGSDEDNRFFTRQDLLRFQQTHGAAMLDPRALPYLTTFSPDLNRPTYSPDPARPKVKAGATTAGNTAYGHDDAINPALSLRKDAGSGAPVIRQRFPLERLKYFASEDNAQKLAVYFGVKWNATLRSWDYVEGHPIKRLEEISDRDPNFMELLKAAISAGSLGGQWQVAEEPVDSPRTYSKAGDPSTNPPFGRDGSIDRHVLQIAANIIDQYDADSYPTRINFESFPISWTVSGVEDIPYLYGFRIGSYRQGLVQASDMSVEPPVSTGRKTPYRCVVFIQPILWNPHAPPETSTPDKPASFRITADTLRGGSSALGYGLRVKSSNRWWGGPNANNDNSWVSNWPISSTNADPRDTPDPAPTEFQPTQDYITFNTTDSGKSAFREPYALKSPNYPPGSSSAAPSNRTETTIGQNEQNDPAQSDELSNSAIGFRAGWAWAGPPAADPNSGSGYSYLQWTRIEPGASVDVELQYRAQDGSYVTYDRWDAFSPRYQFRSDYPDSGNDTRLFRGWFKEDPRTDRYGARSQNYFARTSPPTAMATSPTIPQGQSMRPSAAAGFTWAGGSDSTNHAEPVRWLYAAPAGDSALRRFGFSSENLNAYQDPDGQIRPAMGAHAKGTVGLPMVVDNMASRPRVLNRPFRSVAELGHAFRGQPWKQLDFSNPQSGDAALLDVFCLYEPVDEENAVGHGRVNLNTRHPEVLKALLLGTQKRGGDLLTEPEAANVAAELVMWTSGTSAPEQGPLRNRAELVGKWVAGNNAFAGFSSRLKDLLAGDAQAIDGQKQSVIRALADAGTTRTWMVLIDLIVQEGRYPENTTASGLGKFVVKGEKRYWIHVSIDRFTGEVVDQFAELVNER